jgi:hypothetical protein
MPVFVVDKQPTWRVDSPVHHYKLIRVIPASVKIDSIAANLLCLFLGLLGG